MVRLTSRRLVALAALQVVLLAVLLVRHEHANAAPASASAAARAATPPTTAHRFDVERAMATVRLQLAAGQRPAGSPQLRRVAEQLRAKLPNGRFEDVPGHPGLRNVIGSLPGVQPAIVVGAHYDTEYHPKGFVGANDAAAAVGAVIEIARDLQRIKRPAGSPAIEFVLFDGEEEPFPTEDFYLDALRGSKAYADAHAVQTRAMVLLDYIGNRGVRLPREGTSNPKLWSMVRVAARKVGAASVFPLDVQTAITDDHTPFLQHNIPAVDLIDWSYPVKDTNKDTYDQLSPRAVDAVGETIVELLRTWR
ncbi:M28 family metallopeptidase [Baekduia sp. Peel2402]|uniref:M28 family metallopeptidase n=1 Tax=Baekduia sp. Peel2402 TaxID=3458296 RepID=UPI00403E6D9F